MASNLKKNYPLDKVVPFSTIREMIELAVGKDGKKVAFKYKNPDESVAEVKYSEFYNDINALGTSLTALGALDSPDSHTHIAIISDNSYKWVHVYLTVLMSRGVFVPIDRELPESDIIYLLKESDSTVVFYSRRYENIMTKYAPELTNIKYFIRLDDEPVLSDTPEDNIARFISYSKILESGRIIAEGSAELTASESEEEQNFLEEYKSMTSDPNALKMLVYTSGTTGMAKGVMLTEHNLVSSVYYGLQVSTVYETSLSVLPYHHTYEAVSGLLVSLHKHATICINENLRAVSKNFGIYKPDYIYLVPAFVEEFYKRIWANAEKTGKADSLRKLMKVSNNMRKAGIDLRRKLFAPVLDAFGGKLKKIVCGGAPIRAELGEFFDTIGIDLINGYGITECSPLVSANRDRFNDPSTVGTVLPCCEITFDDVSEDGEGEICVKGDVVMLGYYKNQQQTDEVLTDGVFHTGDFGKFNDKEQLIITGRKKNLIVLSNGKNVFPEELETYIMAIPYIKEVVVYGLKNSSGEEYRLCAEVFLNEEKLSEMKIENIPESLRADISAAISHLANYKHIGKVIIRKHEFDKTTSQKIKRASVEGE